MHDGPLLMTLSESPDAADFTAYDIVNDWSEESLMDILEGYGEEKYAWHIVQGIIRAREESPISSTLALAQIISDNVPGKYRNGGIHPATKTFQALVTDILGTTLPISGISNGGTSVINSDGTATVTPSNTACRQILLAQRQYPYRTSLHTH